jgi:3'(2'), 5'-bisphosphate nucleotidase
MTLLNYEPDEILARSRKLTLPASPSSPLQVVASRSHLSQETKDYIDRLGGGKEVEMVSAGSSLKFCLVAEGRADVYPRFAPTMEWDTAAGQAVVEQAGGLVFSRETGKPMVYNKENLLNPWFIAGRKDLIENDPWRSSL